MKILPLTQFNIQNTQKRKQYISFEGFKCSEDSFEVKNLYNIPCPICAKPMIHTSEIEEFSKEAENKTGEKLIKLFNQYQNYLHEKEKILVEKIKLEAINEDENLEILTKKCIKEHFDAQKAEQLRIIERLKNSTNNIDNPKKEEILKLAEKYEAIIKGGKEFNKSTFLDEIERISSFSNTFHKKTMKNVKKIPDGKDATSVFYRRLETKNSAEIAKELLSPSLVTTEHIKTQYSGGENNTANYLAQCADCNNERGNKEFRTWASSFPDFAKNINQYIEAVAQKIKKGELDEKYDTYLEDITETIKQETQGRIILKAPEIKKGSEPEEKETIYNYISKLNRYKNEIQEKLNSTIETKEQMKNDEQYQYVVEYTSLMTKLNEQEQEEKEKLQQRQECQDKIEFYYQKREEIEDLTIQLKNQYLPSKNRSHLENKLVTIKNQIQKIDTQGLKTQVAFYDIELSEITMQKNKLKIKINSLKELINFPQNIESELNAIKTHFETLDSQYSKINNLYGRITQKNSLLRLIKEKEIRLSNLILSNQQIDTSKSNGEDVKTYRNLIALHERAIVIEDMFLKKNKP